MDLSDVHQNPMGNSQNEGVSDWKQLCEGLVNDSCGFVSSKQAAEDVIKQFETLTKTRFTSFRSPKNFGNTDLQADAHRVQWEHGPDRRDGGRALIHVPYDGVPFFVLASKLMECQYGPERNQCNKIKYAKRTKDNPNIKRRFLTCGSKKLGCMAKLYVYEVVRFPDYKVTINSKGRRQRKSQAVKRDLRERPSGVIQERRIYLCLPADTDHSGHALDETIPNASAKRSKSKARGQAVEEAVTLDKGYGLHVDVDHQYHMWDQESDEFNGIEEIVEEEVIMMPSDDVENTDDVELTPLPRRKRKKSSLKIAASLCRERLGKLQRLTYLCRNETTLQQLAVFLEEASEFVNQHLYAEGSSSPESRKQCRKNLPSMRT